MAEVTADMGKEGHARGRARRVAKWAGLVVSIVIAAAWFVSSEFEFRVTYISGRDDADPEYDLTLADGGIGYHKGYAPWRNYPEIGFEWNAGRIVQIFPRASFGLPFSTMGWTFVPLWIPFLVSAVATLAIWKWPDSAVRRRRSGRCVECGYDRRGLVVGAACPECGAAAPAAAKRGV